MVLLSLRRRCDGGGSAWYLIVLEVMFGRKSENSSAGNSVHAGGSTVELLQYALLPESPTTHISAIRRQLCSTCRRQYSDLKVVMQSACCPHGHEYII